MTDNLAETVFSLYKQRPNVVVLMSGNGSNARAILDDTELSEYFDITTVATDNQGSSADAIAEAYGLELVSLHHEKFSNNPSERESYFASFGEELRARKVEAIFYAGFMKITTPEFCRAFPGVNIHPADLSIKGLDGVAIYRGMHALSRMRSNHGFVRSTVHVVDPEVDSGLPISLSPILYPNSWQSDADVHQQLKSLEHITYTRTLRLLGSGSLNLAQIPIEITKNGEANHDN